MSTEATQRNEEAAGAPVAKIAPTEQQSSQTGVPKKIVNAQTVCNERNEKGKLCNGHLKQLRTGGEESEIHLRGDDVLFKCQSCGTLYMGPPLGHVRDPQKQRRVVETELAALLQAAGGSLPAFKKSSTGAWVPVGEPESHAPATAKPAAAKPAAADAAKPATAKPASAAPASASATPAAPRPTGGGRGIPPPPAHLAPPPNETHEEKRARLARVVAEAKQRAGKEVPPAIAALAAKAPPTPARTTPSAASTSGTDSSPSADAHRPAAEAQAATGQASAAPLSAAAATASPAAGAETPEDLAPDASTELTPGAPPTADATASSSSAAPKPATPPRAAAPAPSASSGGQGIPPPPPHLAPPPGETHEEKIARLRLVVEEAKRRAGKL